jgi:hypothetical protein
MHRGIHSPTERAVRHQHSDSATGHELDRDTSGPAPIGDYLPKLRLRVRTIPTLVWRDGAWRVEWIVVSCPELIHAAPRRLSNPVTESGRRA